MTVQCPEGMKLVTMGGDVYPTEGGYCIQKKPVTRAAYSRDQFAMAIRIWDGSRYVSYGPYGPTQEEQSQPVTNVTWDQALNYCQSTFQGGSLPTAKQWLKGCVIFCSTSGNVALKEGRGVYPFFDMFLIDQGGPGMITHDEWVRFFRRTISIPGGYFRNIFGMPSEWLLDEKNELKFTARIWPQPHIAGEASGQTRHFNHFDWIGFRCVGPVKK